MYHPSPSPAAYNPRPISSNPSIIRLGSEITLLFLGKNADHPRNPSLMKGDLTSTSSVRGQNDCVVSTRFGKNHPTTPRRKSRILRAPRNLRAKKNPRLPSRRSPASLLFTCQRALK